MSTSTTVEPTRRKRMVHTVLSMLLFVLGVALLIYMITVEDEPGAVPLALIVLGIGWFAFARVRMRPRAGGARDAMAP